MRVNGCDGWLHQASPRQRQPMQLCRAERKEFYDLKDMPPLPFQLRRITIPSINHVVVDKSLEPMRRASLAIFSDICSDAQYNSRLNRKSALTALCMFDRDDVDEAKSEAGVFPNIDLLVKVYNEGLDLEMVVEELDA